MNHTYFEERATTAEAISLVVTILNEASSLDGLMASIAAQTRAPDEVIVVDGGSTDGTWELLQTWVDRLPLKAVRRAGLNISQGRNAGLAGAKHGWIAVTDAGVRLEPDWLEQLYRCGEASGADVVAGFFESDPRTPFEMAMGATVLPAVEDVDPERFLPSSRSVMVRREAWQKVGGYPEWLDYCEDLVFDLALKQAGQKFAFAPDAIVRFRPRGSPRQLFRQYYLYARGDGKADLWRGRHAIRYLTYLGALLVLARGGRHWLTWGMFVLGAAAYTRRPYQRLWAQRQNLSGTQLVYAWLQVPLIRLVGDVAKMLGYPVGVWWRIGGRGARQIAVGAPATARPGGVSESKEP